MHSRARGDQLEVFDLGEGMLAQAEVWQPAEADKDAAIPDPLEPGDVPADDDSTGTEL